MELSDLTGDVDFSGEQIAAFVDLVALQGGAHPSPKHLDRLRTAERIQRAAGARDWTVTLSSGRGVVAIPIAGV